MAAELLYSLFYKIILPNSAAGALFILFILFFRKVTKRLSKGYVRILWMLLLVELLVPPLISGPFRTVRNLVQTVQGNQSVPYIEETDSAVQKQQAQQEGIVQQEHMQQENAQQKQKPQQAQQEEKTQQEHMQQKVLQQENTLHVQLQEHRYMQTDVEHMQQEEEAYAKESWQDLHSAVLVIWLAGVIGFCAVYLLRFLSLRQRVADAVYVQEDGCYAADAVLTPFVMPLLIPRIYMPSGITGDRRVDILAHERQHIKNMDPFIKCLAAFAASVHWFNPFVWAAYALISRDLEMYCDECVLRDRTMDERKRYSYALLQYASESSGLSVMLHFGKSDTENRIRHILFWKKPRRTISILLILVMAVCGTFFLTSKNTEEDRRSRTEEEGMTVGQNAQKMQAEKAGEQTKDLSSNLDHIAGRKNKEDKGSTEDTDSSSENTISISGLETLRRLYIDYPQTADYQKAISFIRKSGLPYSEVRQNGSRVVKIALEKSDTAFDPIHTYQQYDYIEVNYMYPKLENDENDELDKYYFTGIIYTTSAERKYQLSSYASGTFLSRDDEFIDTSMNREEQMDFLKKELDEA